MSTYCACKYAQSLPTPCDPMDYSLPASSIHEISQARILEWLSFPTPGDLPDSRIELTSLASPALAGGFFTTEPLIKVKHLLNITHINPCV